MSKYAVINLKTDPALKKKVSEIADKLGVSVSAVLNNELRRFAAEQHVSFDIPEVPNERTAKQLAASRKRIASGDYHRFDSKKASLDFLARELR